MIRLYDRNNPPEVDRVAVLYLTAANDGSRATYSKILEKLSDEFTQIPVYMVELEDHPDLVMTFRVVGVPELVAFPIKNGEPTDRMIGAKRKGETLAFFEGLLV